PARVDLVPGRTFWVEILAPIPARRRHFRDRIDLVEDVRPESLEIRGPRQDGANADDGDRSGWRRGFVDHHKRTHGLELAPGAIRHLAVQVGERADAVTQGGDLTDHVHAPSPLLLWLQARQPGRSGILAVPRVAIQPFRGHAQPADIQLLEAVSQ